MNCFFFNFVFLQSSQTAFQEQHINGLELDEELFIELGDEEGMDGMEAMNGLDLFGDYLDGKFFFCYLHFGTL